jgi:mono/diheme cytochrome c family protein
MGIRTKTLIMIAGIAVVLGACKRSAQEKDDETPTEEPSTAAQVAEESAGEAEPSDAGPSADAASEPVSGEAVYSRVCVTCHGETGDGQGLEQKLFGFDAPESEWTNGPTIEGIEKTLQEGIHATSMKPFPEYGEAERRAVAEYVLQLRENLQKTEPDEGE